MTPTFNDFTDEKRAAIETCLKKHLKIKATPWASKSANFDIKTLTEAMRYSVLGGGKRLRALLVYASYEAIAERSSTKTVDKLAAAIECIHAYSLVHDDLPAMDNDDLRRGKPTAHIKFDEATAILAGDGLHTLAFELVADSGLKGKQLQQAVKTLASASGAQGMVGGQQFDLQSEGQKISLEELQNLHQHKTGALIRASVLLGGIAAAASPEELYALDNFACKAGLAFQVVDDILDIEGNTEQLGKTQGADIALNKATYPALLGLTESKAYAQTLNEKSKAYLKRIPKNTETISQIADYIINRQH